MSRPTGSNLSSPISLWKWMAGIVLLAAFGAAILHFDLHTRAQALLKQLLEWIATLGAWGPVLFILLYIISCVIVLPASLITLGGGAVFGVVRGAIYVSIGATLGASAAFLIGRYFARDWVARKMAGHPGFMAIDKAVAAEGWKIVLLTRLSPIFPFFLLNYAYGLTQVSFRHYVLATWIGILPGSTLFVYIGSLANPGEARAGVATWVFRLVGLVATVAITIYIAKIARRALAKKIQPPAGEEPEPTMNAKMSAGAETGG